MRPGGAYARNYFAVAGTLALALTLLGFSDNLLTRIDQPSNSSPRLVIHGLFCLAWMVLFALQANLARVGNLRLHRRLGLAGAFVAAGTAISTIYVFYTVWKGWDAMAPEIRINRLLMPGFAVLVAAGLITRKRRPDWHKRLLYLATLYMMEPVLSRSFDPFDPWLLQFTDAQVDTAWLIYFAVVWNGLFLSLFVYDWAVLRRIHPATITGYAGFAAIWAIALAT